MQSSQMITLKTTEDEIRQIYGKISSYITTLDESIKEGEASLFTPQAFIDMWKDKKAVLEVALLCLSGDKDLGALNFAILNHPHCKDREWWWERKTENFLKRVTIILEMPGSTRQFLLSCIKNNFILLPLDIQLLVLCKLDNSVGITNVAKTSHYTYSLFQLKPCVLLLRPLLNHAALGEWMRLKNHGPDIQKFLN